MQFPQYGCSERIHNACFPRIYVVFQNAPLYQKNVKKKTIAFSIVFPLTPHFRLFSVFQRVSRLDMETIVFRLSVFLEFTTFYRHENAPQLCIKIGVLIWLRELDLNQRPSGYEPDELPSCSIPRSVHTPHLRVLIYYSTGCRKCQHLFLTFLSAWGKDGAKSVETPQNQLIFY